MQVRKASELLATVAGVGFFALGWIIVWGRAINSQAAIKATALPFAGAIIGSLRAATNQVYDVTGED